MYSHNPIHSLHAVNTVDVQCHINHSCNNFSAPKNLLHTSNDFTTTTLNAEGPWPCRHKVHTAAAETQWRQCAVRPALRELTLVVSPRQHSIVMITALMQTNTDTEPFVARSRHESSSIAVVSYCSKSFTLPAKQCGLLKSKKSSLRMANFTFAREGSMTDHCTNFHRILSRMRRTRRRFSCTLAVAMLWHTCTSLSRSCLFVGSPPLYL